MQQRTFDGEGHRECEQPLPSALGSVISGLGGSNEPELVRDAGGVFGPTIGIATTGNSWEPACSHFSHFCDGMRHSSLGLAGAVPMMYSGIN